MSLKTTSDTMGWHERRALVGYGQIVLLLSRVYEHCEDELLLLYLFLPSQVSLQQELTIGNLVLFPGFSPAYVTG